MDYCPIKFRLFRVAAQNFTKVRVNSQIRKFFCPFIDILSNNFSYRLFLCVKVVNFAPDKPPKRQMKRFFAILLFVLTLTCSVSAQNVIIDERLPDLNLRKWLMDFQPEPTEYTCYLFYHSESEQCKRALNIIKPLIDDTDSRMGLVIITKEEYEDAGVTLTGHLDDNVCVAFDINGRAYRSVGVDFIPFCIICNKKRQAMWCGNGATLTQTIMNKILTTK